MAAPAGTNVTYGGVGIREDLADVIYDLFPMDTWFLSNCAKTTANNTTHEWQMDTLAAAGANSALEGDDFTAASSPQPTRLKNYTQIATKSVVVSGTFEAVDKAGRDREMTRQMMKRGLELKRDIEYALVRNQAATAGAAASARLCGGLETWIYFTQHIKPTGVTTASTPAPVNGVAQAVTDGTTAASFTETDLKSALEQQWVNGGGAGTLMMSSTMKKQFDTFAGVATRFRDVSSRQQAQVIGSADIYVSSYGSHTVVLNRYMRPNVVFALDMEYWAVAHLPGRNMKRIDPGVTGDNQKAMLLSEFTLVARQPLASVKLGYMNS